MPIQTPAVLDITIYKGSYFTRTITYKQGVPPAAVPVNLTGYTIRGKIRSAYGVSPALCSFNISPSSNLAQGEIIIELFAPDSANIEASKGVWDLEIVPPTGENYASQLIRGAVTFAKEATTGAP